MHLQRQNVQMNGQIKMEKMNEQVHLPLAPLASAFRMSAVGRRRKEGSQYIKDTGMGILITVATNSRGSDSVPQ